MVDSEAPLPWREGEALPPGVAPGTMMDQAGYPSLYTMWAEILLPPNPKGI
jgi:hypothetical protein